MNHAFIDKLKNYKANTSGVRRISSVLIPLIKRNGQWHVVYEVRSKLLTSQPGEICFPGGKMECHESSRDTAVRETCEELCLEESDIEVINQMDSIMTSFDMLIHCYVGIIHKDFDAIHFSKDEVDSLFTVPLETLMSIVPEEHTIDTKYELSDTFPFEAIPDGKNYNFKNTTYPVIFYQYEDKNIWGLTARMTKRFIQILQSQNES